MLFTSFHHPESDRTDFLLDCDHATTALTLEGDRTGDEAEVLGNLIETHRTNVVKANPDGDVICLHLPDGWIRGEPVTVR